MMFLLRSMSGLFCGNDPKELKGLLGKKGVLWWSIDAIIAKAKKKPRFLILENDRLSVPCLKEVDFAVMLHSLNNMVMMLNGGSSMQLTMACPAQKKGVHIRLSRQSGRSQIPQMISMDGFSKGVLSSEFELEPIKFGPSN